MANTSWFFSGFTWCRKSRWRTDDNGCTRKCELLHETHLCLCSGAVTRPVSGVHIGALLKTATDSNNDVPSSRE